VVTSGAEMTGPHNITTTASPSDDAGAAASAAG